MEITLTELEAAINFWRLQSPATGEECALSSEVNALASLYALMIFEHRSKLALDALENKQRTLLENWQTHT